MAKLRYSPKKTFNLKWIRSKSGWHPLTEITSSKELNELEGVYVIGCRLTAEETARRILEKNVEKQYATIAVGQGEVGNRLREKHKELKYTRRAKEREMVATYAGFPEDKDGYRDAIERFLGEHYELDKLGDRFPASSKVVQVNPPW